MGGIQPNFFIKNVTFEYDYDYNTKTIANPSLWWWCTKGSFNIKIMANSKGTLDLCKINFDTKL